MFRRLSSSTLRALGVGLALTAVTAASTQNLVLVVAMLLTVLAVAAIAQYGSRFERQ